MAKVSLGFSPEHITLDMADEGGPVGIKLVLPSADMSDHQSNMQGKAHRVTYAYVDSSNVGDPSPFSMAQELGIHPSRLRAQ